MAIDYDIDSVHNAIYIVIYDHISMSDIEDIVATVRRDPRCTQGMGALIDAREIKRAFFFREMDNLVTALASDEANFIARYAFVVTHDLASNLGRRFLVKARWASLSLALFRDHSAAVNWIEREHRQGGMV